MNKYLVNILIGAFCWSGMSACASPKDEAKEIVDIISILLSILLY